MFPSNAQGLYCPGCAPGDFPQPHICGISNPVPAPFSTWTTQTTAPISCHHCFCLEQEAGWYHADKAPVFSPLRELKPHEVCCMCETRRVKERP